MLSLITLNIALLFDHKKLCSFIWQSCFDVDLIHWKSMVIRWLPADMHRSLKIVLLEQFMKIIEICKNFEFTN